MGLNHVKMPFPLEMRGPHPYFFNKPIKNHRILKIEEMKKSGGNKCAFHQIKNQRIL